MPKHSKETIQNAKRWFDSFKAGLAGLGITLDNPAALSLVRVRDNSGSKFIQQKHRKAMDCLDAAEKGLNCSMLAFARMNEKHGYLNGFQPGRDRLEWMLENMVNEDTISDDQIVYLYNMSREGRLYIMSDDLTPMRFTMDQNVITAGDGSAVILPDMNLLAEDAAHGGKLYEQYGYTAESFDKIKWETWTTSADNNTNFLIQVVAGQQILEAHIAKYKKMPGQESYVAQARERYQDFTDLQNAQNMGLQYAHAARMHPSWFRDPGSIGILTRLGKLLVKPEEERTPEDERFLARYPVLDHQYMTMEESLLKTAGVRDPAELMGSDIITDVEGNPIQAENEIEYLSNVYRGLQRGELLIRGIPYSDMGMDLGLMRSIGRQEYDLATGRICDILTDSDMEAGGLSEDPAYDAFKSAALALAHSIQSNLSSNSYGFPELQADMRSPAQAARDYLAAHADAEIQQGIYADRIRAAQELLDLAGKAADRVIHPMEKPDYDRIAKKQSVFHEMLIQRYLDPNRYEDTSAHLFYQENGAFRPLLPADYAQMTPERFNREIVPKLESGEVYLSEFDSTSFRRVSLEENVPTGEFRIALGREKRFADVNAEHHALHQQRVDAIAALRADAEQPGEASPVRRGVYTAEQSVPFLARLAEQVPADIAEFARQMNEELWMEEPAADAPIAVNVPDGAQDAKAQPKNAPDPMKLFRARFLASPKTVLDQMKDRCLVQECGLSDEAIAQFANDALPGLRRPGPEAKKYLTAQKEALSARIYEQELYYHALTGMERGLPHWVQALCPLGDYSAPAVKDALNFFHAFRDGSEVTPNGKKEAMARQLHRVAKIDLRRLDPTDPQTMINNPADALTVMRVGSEMPQLIAQIKAFGPQYMADPRVRLFLQKAEAMYALAPALDSTINMVTSSVYPELGPNAGAYYQPERKIVAPDSEFGAALMAETTVGQAYGMGNSKAPFNDAGADASAGSFAMALDSRQRIEPSLLQGNTPMAMRLDALTKDSDRFAIRQYWDINKPTVGVFVKGNSSTTLPDARMETAAKAAVNGYLNAQTGEYGAKAMVRDFLADPMKVFGQLKSGYCVDQRALSDEAIDDFIQNALPGYTRPTPEEKEHYARQQRELSERYYAMILQREILSNCGPGTLAREWQGFFSWGDMRREAIDEAVTFIRAFSRGSTATDAQKKELLAEKLKKLAAIDLSRLDPTNPDAIMANLNDVMTVLNVGSEMQPIIRTIREFGAEYMDDPRVRAFLEKADILYELSGPLGSVTSMMCTSLYPELGIAPIYHYDDSRAVTARDPDSNLPVESDVAAVYGNAMYPVPINDTSVDGSARGYVIKCAFCSSLKSPLMDPSRSMQERVNSYLHDEKKDFFKLKAAFVPKEEAPAEGIAPEKNYFPQHAAVEAPDAQTQILVNRLIYGTSGSGGYSIPEFHPAAAQDVGRLYKLGANGYYVPAFPEAARPDWQGLTGVQLKDLLTTKDKYVYFAAGERAPRIFQNGILKLQTHKVADTEHPGKTIDETTPVSFVFGSEGYRRQYGPLSELETRQLAIEQQIHRRDMLFLDQRRVEEMERAIFGSHTADRGSEQYRTYQQECVNHMWEVDPDGSFTYPAPSGTLTESEIAILTILSIARPDVNGKRTYLQSDNADVFYGYNMAVNDLYTLRNATPTGTYAKWVLAGRQALAPVLRSCYSGGGMKALAETVAKGIRVVAVASANLTQLSAQSLPQMLPAKQLTELFAHHPDLLKAARQYAADNGIADFEASYARIRSSADLYDRALGFCQAERRLLAYDNGEFRDADGHMIMPASEERAALSLEAAKLGLFNQDAARYTDVSGELIPAKEQTRLNAQLAQAAALDAAQTQSNVEESQAAAAENRKPRLKKVDYIGAAHNERLYVQKSQPVSPLVELVTMHENGMEALDTILDSMKDKRDYDAVLDALRLNGLIPEDGRPNPKFDYDSAIRSFQYDRAKLYSEDFARDFEAKYGAIAEEAGLDFETIRDLAASHGITPEEYMQRLIRENRLAEEKAEPNAPGLGEFEALIEALPEKLTENRLGQKELKAFAGKLCTALKDLNRFSVARADDFYGAYQAGELLTRLCIRMHSYETENPMFREEKAKLLSSADYAEAQQTVMRSREAAKQMKSEVLNKMPAAIDENLNAYKQQYQSYLKERAAQSQKTFAEIGKSIEKYTKNLRAVYGVQPRKTGSTQIDRLVELCGPGSRITLPEGFTEESVQMLMRLSLMLPGIAAKLNTTETNTTAGKMSRMSGHALDDIMNSRDATSRLLGECIPLARRVVGTALDSYRKDGSAELLGEIIGKSLKYTVNMVIDGNNEHTVERYMDMKGHTALLDLLEKEPALMKAAKDHGLTNKDLHCLKAHRTLAEIFERNAAALRDLYSEGPTGAEKLKNQVLDLLMGEVSLKLLVGEQDRLTGSLAKAGEKDMRRPIKDSKTKKISYPDTNLSLARLNFETSENYDRLADGIRPMRAAIERSDVFRKLMRDLNNGFKPSRLVELRDRMKATVNVLTDEYLRTPPAGPAPLSPRPRANSSPNIRLG